MSLMLEDPIKYKEMRAKFKKEDEETVKNTVAFMKNMSEGDIGDFLDYLGRFFHHTRVNNKMSLRAFCKKYSLDAKIVSDVERGLRLPNLELMDIYLRDDIKEKPDNTNTTNNSEEDK